MEVLTRNQKIAIINAVCGSNDNNCYKECFLRVENADGFCKITTEYTDEEIDRCLHEIFRRCGMTHQPEKRDFMVIMRPIRDSDDMDAYCARVQLFTERGCKIESCGINGSASEHQLAWAIVSKPVEEG